LGGGLGTVPLRVQVEESMELICSQGGKAEKVQLTGAISPETVQVVEYCCPAV
jgi:hypothetical protein